MTSLPDPRPIVQLNSKSVIVQNSIFIKLKNENLFCELAEN